MGLKKSRADQEFVAVHKRSLRAKNVAVEWKIDEIDVFLDRLVCCQVRCNAADEYAV